MKTIVAIGSDAHPDYSFPLVLSCLFWRDVVGHEPRAYLVGDEAEWLASPRTKIALEALHKHEIQTAFVAHLPPYSDATVAQHVRIHAACDTAIPDEQWIMLSDADLWPLKRDFYLKHEAPENETKKAVCLYANGDHFQGKAETLSRYAQNLPIQSLPICHITMRAREWRSLYNLVPNDVTTSTKRTLDEVWPWVEKCPDKGLATWCIDQWEITKRLSATRWFPHESALVDRYGHPPVDRLDRSTPENWQGAHDLTKWSDTHIFKAPSEDKAWAQLSYLVDCLLPEHASWARGYREAWVCV